MRFVTKSTPGVRRRQIRFVLSLLASAAAGLTGCVGPSNTSEALDHGVVEVRDFVSETSQLRMYKYIPASARGTAPMVVVLHHCFQNALDYFVDAGWGRVADDYGLVLLIPEQSPESSFWLCFDFAARHQPGNGEAGTIRRMTDRMMAEHDIDQRRIFITGMSAGASMAIVMMAYFPELFAGGGVIGSVPFGCPDVALGMLSCIQAGADRAVTTYQGRWPRLSVWAGSLDWVSRPENSAYIARQWAALHGVSGAPAEISETGQLHREVYRDATGEAVVESVTIAGIGHSVPIDSRQGCGGYRGSQMFALVSDVGVCSSEEMVRFWHLQPVGAHTVGTR